MFLALITETTTPPKEVFDLVLHCALDYWYDAAQNAFAQGADAVAFLEGGETCADWGQFRAAAKYAVDNDRSVVVLPHDEPSPDNEALCMTYRARIFHREVPHKLLRFVGPARDASFAQGLLAYRGLLVENVITHSTISYAQRLERDASFLQLRGLALGRVMQIWLALDVSLSMEIEDLFVARKTLSADAALGWAMLGHSWISRGICDTPVAALRTDDALQAVRLSATAMPFFAWSAISEVLAPAWALGDAVYDPESGHVAVEALPVVMQALNHALTLQPNALNTEALRDSCRIVWNTNAERTAPFHPSAALTEFIMHELPKRNMRAVFELPQNAAEFGKLEQCANAVVFSEAQRAALLQMTPSRGFAERVVICRLWGVPPETLPAKTPGLVFWEPSGDPAHDADLQARLRTLVPTLQLTDDVNLLGTCVLYVSAGLSKHEPWAPYNLINAQLQKTIPVCVGTGAIPEYMRLGFFYKMPATAESCKHALIARAAELLNNPNTLASLLARQPYDLFQLTFFHTIWAWKLLISAC